MRKPEERRDKQFNIGLTVQEYAQVLQRAANAGMRPVDYARAKLFSAKNIEVTRERRSNQLDPLFLLQLSRLGNNLNQCVRKLHQFGAPVPGILTSLLQEIRDHIRRGPG